jgi:uncharacterized protein YdaU (DUF1376 family)
MHYYKRNIGDYAKKAGRLSLLEHGVYTLLIDACYDRERFPTLEEAIDWTWARSDDEVAAVKFVLARFFDLQDGVYVQNRIAEEIAHYHDNAEKNKRIALEREQKRTNRTRTVNEASPDVHEAPPNQEPRTTNQEPVTNVKTRSPSGSRLSPDWVLPIEWQEWAEAERPDLEIGAVACQFRDYWIAKAGKDGRKMDWAATWRNWVRQQRKEVSRPASFADHDEQQRRRKWEEMTGRKWPQDNGTFIDVQPADILTIGANK